MPDLLVGFLFGLVTTPILFGLWFIGYRVLFPPSIIKFTDEEKRLHGIGVEKERWNDTA